MGNNPQGASLYFVTSEAKEIVQLISDYRENTEARVSVLPAGNGLTVEQTGSTVKKNRKRKESGAGAAGGELEKRMGFVTDTSDSGTYNNNDVGNLEDVNSSISNIENELSLHADVTCFRQSGNKLGSMDAMKSMEDIDLMLLRGVSDKREFLGHTGSQQPLLVKESPSPIESVSNGSHGRPKTTVSTDL